MIKFNEDSLKENLNSRKANPSEIQEIVDKMYYIPEKKPDIDFKSLREEE
jgi:hypothetical protein